jgi:hypothetical protein
MNELYLNVDLQSHLRLRIPEVCGKIAQRGLVEPLATVLFWGMTGSDATPLPHGVGSAHLEAPLKRSVVRRLPDECAHRRPRGFR